MVKIAIDAKFNLKEKEIRRIIIKKTLIVLECQYGKLTYRR